MNQINKNCSPDSSCQPIGCNNNRRNQGSMNMGRCSLPQKGCMPRKNCCPQDCKDSSDASTDPLRGMPVGIGYVPWQQWECTYSPDEGLCKGTIFPSLDLPFYGCIPRGYCKGGKS